MPLADRRRAARLLGRLCAHRLPGRPQLVSLPVGKALHAADLRLFAGRTIDVPAIFIGGDKDWGVRQTPGALESMRDQACTRFEAHRTSCPSAGHWVQQEQPEAVIAALLPFLTAR